MFLKINCFFMQSSAIVYYQNIQYLIMLAISALILNLKKSAYIVIYSGLSV